MDAKIKTMIVLNVSILILQPENCKMLVNKSVYALKTLMAYLDIFRPEESQREKTNYEEKFSSVSNF